MSIDAITTDVTIGLSSSIVAAYVGRNIVPVNDLPALIASVHAAITTLTAPPPPAPEVTLTPAVPVKKSVTPDYLICLEDGKKLKMLKRHLKTAYDLTPDEYRAKWGLSSDYPMVAANYAKARSDLAVKLGLGRRAA